MIRKIIVILLRFIFIVNLMFIDINLNVLRLLGYRLKRQKI